jgi:hypothetical protein
MSPDASPELTVKVLADSNRGQFRWEVRDAGGRVAEAGQHSYSTEIEAFRAGNAAARAIRKRTKV